MKLSKKKSTNKIAQEKVVSFDMYKELKVLEEYKKKYAGNPTQLEKLDEIIKLVMEGRATFKIVDGKPRLFTPEKIRMKPVRASGSV